ncbi:DUF3037 domain-containing protein [Persicitalea jodogahamensis]|uniref:DUF3037 domain-containing protein n=1 Tax=Persicitalea jodogahamensis TaxID=402147 RepID=A0A8J3D286_9BACT|nr:DUF3037 domain-containing protein [Persicitalea jodogahamensis]GHB68554.1 hypothetical protein GCM10007390_22440 [Persicitalea jodogahamensis]
MKKYQYQLLRYVHDQFTEEFVNVGIVMYAPDAVFLQTRMLHKFSRITSFFPGANGRHLIQSLRRFEQEISRVASECFELFKPSEDLSQITCKILPPDDSALVLTEVHYGIDLDLKAALSGLYEDLVEKYLDQNTALSLTNEEVWKQKYKAYFDKYRITEKLVEHNVVTKNDTFIFDKSWKNEIWHCYQPLSFDLQNAEAIKMKAYRWSGKLKEISTTSESIHLTFLTTLPKADKSLKEFIIDALNWDHGDLKIDVILDSDAEKLAQHISYQLQEHEDKVTDL